MRTSTVTGSGGVTCKIRCEEQPAISGRIYGQRGNPLDFIADEAADIAETVVNAVMVDRLKAALPLLSDSEQELIQAIFLTDFPSVKSGRG